MSFMDNLGKMASGLLGGNQGAEQEGQAGGSGEMVQQLVQHVCSGNMDQSTLTGLGQQLLTTFTSHSAYQGDGAQAAAEAGTTQEAVAQGSPNAIASLVQYAQSNPQVLSAAMTAFSERNPQALAQFAPGLLQHFTGQAPPSN
ncbi:MAG TPA: hypothetical protein VKG44_11240 [Candidatus Baltobacteraceae bacterium]|nr:hypothetical protein [Candidatus Baltobacteraceae bacterium]